MNDHIKWVLDTRIQDGTKGAVQPLLKNMVSATRADEPGVITCEYHRTGCTMSIRCADKAAAMTHPDTISARCAERFLSVFAPARHSVSGPAEAALQAVGATFGATFDARFGGAHHA